MIDWMFKKRDAEIAELRSKIKELQDENQAMYRDIAVLVGDDRTTKYNQTKQKWKFIIDFENALWAGDRDSVGDGILSIITKKNK